MQKSMAGDKKLESRERDFESTRISTETNLAEQREDLDTRFGEFYGRENAVANAEAKLQQAKSRNDIESQSFRGALSSALSFLQSLANATGSGYDADHRLDNVQNLVTSIKTRCETLQEDCSEKDQSLTDQQEHLRKVEAKLESTSLELGDLRTRHGREMEKFNSLKQTKFRKGAAVEALAEMRRKFADKTARHDGLLARYATLEAYHQSYSGQLETAKEEHLVDQAQISGLRSHRIPQLEATERDLRSQVRELTEEKKELTAGRFASDVEVGAVKVENQQLEATIQDLRTQLPTADDHDNVMRKSFDIILNTKATEANVSSEAHQRSLQALEKVQAVNHSLNISLSDSNEEWQAAANDNSALKGEKTELRLQISNTQRLLTERNTRIQDLVLVAEETETKINTLES